MTKPLITVFGGTGFLGSRVVHHLNREGIPVRIASRHVEKKIQGLERADLVEYQETDITDEASVSKALHDASGAVNAVSLYVEKGDVTFHKIHVEGAERVARMARDNGVERLIHISGVGASTNSESKFVRARAQGEQVVRSAFEEAVIFRPCVMFGPGDSFTCTLERVTRFPVVTLFGWGETKLQPAYVDDVAAAAAQILLSPNYQSRLFELGGPRVYSYRDIVQVVLRVLRRSRLLVPMPFLCWRMVARVLSVLSNPPLTFDQVILMERDNVVSEGAGFEALDQKPHPLEQKLEDYFAPLRRG